MKTLTKRKLGWLCELISDQKYFRTSVITTKDHNSKYACTYQQNFKTQA